MEIASVFYRFSYFFDRLFGCEFDHTSGVIGNARLKTFLMWLKLKIPESGVLMVTVLALLGSQ